MCVGGGGGIRINRGFPRFQWTSRRGNLSINDYQFVDVDYSLALQITLPANIINAASKVCIIVDPICGGSNSNHGILMLYV